MNKDWYRRDTCRLCNSSELELVLELVPTPIADNYVSIEQISTNQKTYPLDVFLCNHCGHVQLLDIVSPKLLYDEFIYYTANSPGLVKHFQEYASFISNNLSFSDNGLVIDIGSNDGTLLKFIKANGQRVLGIDPACNIAEQATLSGIETLPSFFSMELAESIKAEYGLADIIIANNTIANIDNLDDVMIGIRSLLTTNGVFIFETGYLLDLVQNLVFDNIYHEHIGYHSITSFTKFFEHYDMELIDVVRVVTKGGSIRGIVQLNGGSRPKSSILNELMNIEATSGIETSKPYKILSTKLNDLREQLLYLLGELKSQGKTIAGYGASHSVTTLIYHLGLGNMLEFLVDDNPIKHGLFSPGYHIPVMSSNIIYEKLPDYILVLPWRFSNQIIGKHQSYTDQGGHFIVPLPEIQVI